MNIQTLFLDAQFRRYLLLIKPLPTSFATVQITVLSQEPHGNLWKQVDTFTTTTDVLLHMIKKLGDSFRKEKQSE